MRGLGWMGAGVVAVMMASGCDDASGLGSAGSPLTASELEQRLVSGAARIEVKLGADGVTELNVQGRDAEERVQGWVTAIDGAAGEVVLADIGVVTFGAGARFRTERESRAELSAWIGEIEGALDAGTPVFVRATRLAGAAPQAPEDATFVATDLRIEADGDAKLELDVDVDNFVAVPATLLVLGQAYDLSNVRMTEGDDNGTDDPATHDLGDDNGDDGVEDESGDDNGTDDPATHDLGDDNGDDGVEDETGDDNGTDDPATHDLGDDNGDDGVEDESGDDNGTDDPATHDVGDDNGDDGVEDEAGDDNGDDGVEDEAGDDNGDDGVEDEAGDDNGGGKGKG